MKLVATGDFFAGGTMFNTIKVDPYSLFQGVRSAMSGDIVMTNLEGPFAGSKDEVQGSADKCNLASPAEAISTLSFLGINVVSLANNHIFDCGMKGYTATVQQLTDANISHFGAGADLYSARQPLIIEHFDLRIGFLGYSWGLIQSKIASPSTPGVSPLDRRFILKDVGDLRDKVDVLVVSVHWGYVRERYPLPSQRELGHAIVDAGADLVVGHHPHVVQGIERVGKGLIAYSLGNFFFPDFVDGYFNLIQTEETSYGLILNVEFDQKGVADWRTVIVERAKDNSLSIKQNAQELTHAYQLPRGLNDKEYRNFWKKNKVRKDLFDLYRLPSLGEKINSNHFLYFLMRNIAKTMSKKSDILHWSR
jgi:poly-gamma-glutamate synthesis protein (capsule biosynthesis protein)